MGKNSFLSYYKTILEKVSFDDKLVEKEYWKAKQFLTGNELQEFDNWMRSTGMIHKTSAAPVREFGFSLTDPSRQYLMQQD